MSLLKTIAHQELQYLNLICRTLSKKYTKNT